jgi:hypothetical protein
VRLNALKPEFMAVRRCGGAAMRRCGDAAMRRCGDAAMRRCGDANDQLKPSGIEPNPANTTFP